MRHITYAFGISPMYAFCHICTSSVTCNYSWCTVEMFHRLLVRALASLPMIANLLQCAAVCCRALCFFVVSLSVSALRCLCFAYVLPMYCSVLQCVAVCCSMLQYLSVRSSRCLDAILAFFGGNSLSCSPAAYICVRGHVYTLVCLFVFVFVRVCVCVVCTGVCVCV